MIEPDALARKLDKRESAKVVAYREVGLPMFRLNSLITLQEAGKLGAIEEFVLRSISQNVDTSTDLEVFLGLPHKIIASQLAQVLMDGAITQVASAPPRYQLTRKGKTRIEEAASVRIGKERMSIYVDGITRHAVPVEVRDLWTNAQLEELGVSVVPPVPRKSPRASEVDLADINRMFSALAGDDGVKKRAVRLDALLGRTSIVFRRALAVAFKSDDGRRMSIAFAVDGRESEEHELAYARTPDVERSLLFGVLFDADRRRREVQAVARELRSDLPQIFQSADQRSGVKATLSIRRRAEERLQKAVAGVRVLSVYDHPPLLKQALERAQSRVIIVSPWIRANVVNQDFVSRLIHCLERGVEVTIAYGIGRRDSGERPPDITARESLAALSKSFPNFRFVRKGDTHAKVLLVDSAFFVTTSFNWLSFRGDPKQPMREEEGTMVEDPVLVENYYQTLAARIAAAVSDAQSPPIAPI
jgi:hypothetical protein